MNVPAMIDAKVANSLKGVLIDLIQRDYQFIAGDKIQEMFARDVVDLGLSVPAIHGSLMLAR